MSSNGFKTEKQQIYPQFTNRDDQVTIEDVQKIHRLKIKDTYEIC